MVQLSQNEISEYLTVSVIERALRAKTGSQDNVRSVEVTRAAPAGEGLIGAVYRIKVRGDSHTATFVIKAMSKDILLRKSVSPEKFFRREIAFFSDILPILVEFQKTCGAKERISNQIPVCYAHHCDGKHDFILMEDLQETCCSQIPEVPNENERDAMIKMIAHLHAVSMALRLKRPADFHKLAKKTPELYYSEDQRKWYAAYMQRAIELDLNALAEYEDPKTSVYYKKYLDLVTNDPYGEIIRLVTAPSEHLVLCHGDPWTPNYFISKTRSVMIDFQLCRVSSPVVDLSFMLLLSCNRNPNTKYFLEAIRRYHDALSYFFEDMGLNAEEVFSFEDLNQELRLYGKFGMLAATTTIPLLVSDRADTLADFGSTYGDVEKIPLEKLWVLTPLEREEDKLSLVNAVRLAVDAGFI